MKQLAPLRIISYLAIAIYLFFGFYLLVQPGVIAGMSPTMQKGLGILLMVYGVFRLWLIIQRMRYEKNRSANEEDVK